MKTMMKTLTAVAITAAALTTATIATTGEASAFGRVGFGGHFGSFHPIRFHGFGSWRHDFHRGYFWGHGYRYGWGYGRSWCYWHPRACAYRIRPL